jgi:hypothetical protein
MHLLRIMNIFPSGISLPLSLTNLNRRGWQTLDAESVRREANLIRESSSFPPFQRGINGGFVKRPLRVLGVLDGKFLIIDIALSVGAILPWLPE